MHTIDSNHYFSIAEDNFTQLKSALWHLEKLRPFDKLSAQNLSARSFAYFQMANSRFAKLFDAIEGYMDVTDDDALEEELASLKIIRETIESLEDSDSILAAAEKNFEAAQELLKHWDSIKTLI